MSGNESATYSVLSILFPHYYRNPGMKEKDIILLSETEWAMVCNSSLKKADSKNDELTIEILLRLFRKSDHEVIAELTTHSTYKVSAPLSFSMKRIMFNALVNQTLGHAQGGWQRKNKKSGRATMYAPGYDKLKSDLPTWEQHIYETWE